MDGWICGVAIWLLSKRSDQASNGVSFLCREYLAWRAAVTWWEPWWRSWGRKAGSRSQTSAWLWLLTASTPCGEDPPSGRRIRARWGNTLTIMSHLIVLVLLLQLICLSFVSLSSGRSGGAHFGSQPQKADDEKLGKKKAPTTDAWEYYMVDICYPVNSPFFSLSQTGGAIITTLSQTGSLFTPKSSYLPQELLGEVRERCSFHLFPEACLWWLCC